MTHKSNFVRVKQPCLVEQDSGSSQDEVRSGAPAGSGCGTDSLCKLDTHCCRSS